MQIESRTHRFSMYHRVDRIALSVESLNMRISRLTQMLSLDLSQEADLLRVLRLDGAEENSRHHQRRLQELHALLVMRYDMIKHYAQSLGVAATRSLFLGSSDPLNSEAPRGRTQ